MKINTHAKIYSIQLSDEEYSQVNMNATRNNLNNLGEVLHITVIARPATGNNHLFVTVMNLELETDAELGVIQELKDCLHFRET